MSEELLPIGQFARLCRLSVKQLRNYDELGLLAPAHVDPASGYRYYRRDQARDALSIGLLRSLDLPLSLIGRVLADGGAAAGTLREARDRMEADLDRRRRALATLDRVLADGLPRAEVTVVREPAVQVRAVRDMATPTTFGAVTSACVARLLDGLGPAGPQGPLVGLFPLDLADEIVVGVTAPDPSGGEVLPGGTFAVAVHVGPFDQIAFTGHALLAWCADHGHTPRGPLREIYLTDPAGVAPDELETPLMIKLEDVG
ncbi:MULTISPECIES: MerR family transcriptional regulator [Thermomonosporaceae]|uniref:MerR family transcriptional regulator n=1 Tax=Thermomonosporaceae TaxID=2012 RepID=UPI00255AA07E|nr:MULTISPECIES: GyrI-like domain-containing protein [Thermomonosporaceae]MDL4773316.1 MerR family DNA-binding transcriptional regulator [Actinomadura xylanilytica]